METIAPTSIVIFGVTGDLASRKLFPSLFDLFLKRALPPKYRIVGFSRRPLSPEEFAELISNSLAKKNPSPEHLKDFLAHCFYQQGNFDELASYERLGKRLAEVDEKDFNQCSNKLFYLSVPPNLYEGIFEQLSASGLTIPCGGDMGWTRVLVEKPFGSDSASAKHLDTQLGKLFKEEQIFRIDHYLAKETLQNILTFRFSNSIFEPLWNREHIESVEIRLWEKLDLQGRGAFFDTVGTLRDVGQNHMLQMLALIAMEKPVNFSAQAVRHNRAEVFRALKPIPVADLSKKMIRAQYEGYAEEKGVNPRSDTETYFRLEAEIDNARWKGVPFHIEAGKALDEAGSEIRIRFKKLDPICPIDSEDCGGNILIFRIQPVEGIAIEFFTKIPGLAFEAEPKTLSYLYKDADLPTNIPDAYEKVLYDCIRGDQTLFTSTDEVDATWKYVTPILENLKTLPLARYPKGAAAKNIA